MDCKRCEELKKMLIECSSLDAQVTVPERDYSTMTPKDIYEAGLMDGGMGVRDAIRTMLWDERILGCDEALRSLSSPSATGATREFVSVPKEPTPEMWDAAWKSIGLPYRAKLSLHEIKTLFEKFHAAMLAAAPAPATGAEARMREAVANPEDQIYFICDQPPCSDGSRFVATEDGNGRPLLPGWLPYGDTTYWRLGPLYREPQAPRLETGAINPDNSPDILSGSPETATPRCDFEFPDDAYLQGDDVLKFARTLERECADLTKRLHRMEDHAIRLQDDRDNLRGKLAEARNRALDEALQCYSPDDSSTDWADKIRALKEEA